MKRGWQTTTKVLAGLFVCAMYATPQGTISARPGVVNYVEGHAYVDGHELNASKLKDVALYANQTLSTGIGKAEVLLTPGVFLRIGENSEIRMISPSLTDTQFELIKGKAMIEAAEVVKDSNLAVVDHGAVITIEKRGLYRINADTPPTVSVFDGKASVHIGGQKPQTVKKGRELVLAANTKPEKFDRKKDRGELYAWSKVRSEYEARASYASAQSAAAAGFAQGGLGYGFGAAAGPGWYYNSPWNSWAWLPGSGYAFSPFGYGFYSPGYLGYAPIIVGGGGGYYAGRHGRWDHDHDGDRHWNHNPNGNGRPGGHWQGHPGMGTGHSPGAGNHAVGAGPRPAMPAGRPYGGIRSGAGGHMGVGVNPAHGSPAFNGRAGTHGR